jgi:hypothetical protein
MTDRAELPLPPRPRSSRSGRVTLADSAVSTVMADCIRCDSGCLILMRPNGTTAAYAIGAWTSAEEMGDL